MKFISHRGNLISANPEFENRPNYIEEALRNDFLVEIDVWKINGEYYLGHDCPQHLVPFGFFVKYKSRLFIHCKDHTSFEDLYPTGLEIFWHDLDDFCITSRGHIWSGPSRSQIRERIEVQLCFDPKINLKDLGGICSDQIKFFRDCYE